MTHGVPLTGLPSSPTTDGRSTSRGRASALRGLELARVGERRPAARRAGGGHRLAVDRRSRRRRSTRRGRPGSPGGAPSRTAVISSSTFSARVGRAPSRPPCASRTPSSTLVGGLARRPAAQVLVLADDDLVERAGGDRRRTRAGPRRAGRPGCRSRRSPARSAPPVAAAPIRPGLGRRLDHHPVDEVGQLAHAVDVVAVVDDDADAADVDAG